MFLVSTSFVNTASAISRGQDQCEASSFTSSGDVTANIDENDIENRQSLLAQPSYVDPVKFTQTINQPEAYISARSVGEMSTNTHGQSSRGTRATDTESEPNNDINQANELTAGNNMQGTITRLTDEQDHFYIKLNGGGGSTTDKITITPKFISPPDVDDKAIGIVLAFYEVYNGEIFYFDIIKLATVKYGPNLNPYPWPTANQLVAHATRTQDYFCVVEGAWFVWASNGTVIDPNVVIGYDLEIKVESTPSTDGDNDMFNGTLLEGPITGESVTQATDHWDWYTIETVTTEKPTYTEVSVKITDSERSETDTVTGYVYYVKVFVELWYYDIDTSHWVKVSDIADHHGQYYPNPATLNINDTYEKAYLGIHLQQLFKYAAQDNYANECGDSFVEYSIQNFEVELYNDVPLLKEPSVNPTKGNQLEDYTFTIVYQDFKNDPPLFVNVSVDGEEYEMEPDTEAAKSSYKDGDYSNGEQYIKVVPGYLFTTPVHQTYSLIDYFYSTRDYLESLDLPMSFKKTDTKQFEVIDNTPPELVPFPTEKWTLFEDVNASYFDVTTIFRDVDETNYPDELTYEIYTPEYDDWTKDRVVTENFTVNLLDTNWTLQCVPEPDKFGVDYVKIRASDPAGALKDEYVEYVLQVEVKPVNDAPILDEIPDYTANPDDDQKPGQVDWFLEDWWVNINFTASDNVDGNVDTLTYSTNAHKIIPFLDPDAADYDDTCKYSFDEETGHLSFIPRDPQLGTYKIIVTVTDSGTIEPIGKSDSQTFSLKIANTNDPPTALISSPQDGDVYNTTVPILFDGLNSTDDDLDSDDKLRFTWSTNISDELKNYAGEDYGSFSMILTDPGMHTISLKVRDNSNKISTVSVEIKILQVVEGFGEDTDGDGIPDKWEDEFELDPETPDSGLDSDGDNYTNLQEFLGEDELPSGGDSSDPTDAYSIPGDVDGDQLPDSWEINHFGHINHGPNDDLDGDKWTNLEEYLGDDGLPGNKDYSNPLEPESVPNRGEDRVDVESDDDDDLDWAMIILILIVVVIIVLLLAFMFIKKRREDEREAEEELAAMAEREQEPGMMPMAQPMPMQAMAGPGAPQPKSMPMAQPQQQMPYQQQAVQSQYPPQPMPMPMQPQVQPAPAPAPTFAPIPELESLPPSPEAEEPKAKKPKPKIKKTPKIKGASKQTTKCPSCGVPVQPSWYLCPSCKTPLS
jgi:hypothetical protein